MGGHLSRGSGEKCGICVSFDSQKLPGTSRTGACSVSAGANPNMHITDCTIGRSQKNISDSCQSALWTYNYKFLGLLMDTR